jgi:tetratricopeptide (TPR) repeat protein
MGWTEVAIESLVHAVELRPKDMGVRLSLAQSLVLIGRYEDALVQLEAFRERDQKNPAVMFVRARCLAWKGRKDEAAQTLDQMLRDEPDNWSVLNERGGLWLELDRPAEAEPLLRKAHKLAPPSQGLSSRLADCLRMLGNDDEASRFRAETEELRSAARQVAELSARIRVERPALAQPYFELASAFRRLGKDQPAVHYFSKALEKDAAFRPAHAALAELYSKMGSAEKAAVHRKQAQNNP